MNIEVPTASHLRTTGFALDRFESFKSKSFLGPEDQCDFDGIICLGSHSSRFTVLKSKWSDKDGLACDCLPGCIGADFDIIVADYPDVYGIVLWLLIVCAVLGYKPADGRSMTN